MGREVVEHDVDVELPSTCRSMNLKKARTSVALWDFFVSKSTSPVPTIHGREQIGGAVAFVVMGQSRTPAALHWQRRLGAIEGLTWVFSSKLKTTARSGGFK